MAEAKKDGLFKRLFGGKKNGCCGVTIEEVKEGENKKEMEPTASSGCCAEKETKTQ